MKVPANLFMFTPPVLSKYPLEYSMQPIICCYIHCNVVFILICRFTETKKEVRKKHFDSGVVLSISSLIS